jgi:ABC-type molybdate transport system ATPase subunit
MNFTVNSPLSQEQIKEIVQEQHITVLLEDQSELHADFYFLIDETFSLKEELAVGFILSENTFFPYLSIRDNLFIGSTAKEKQKKQLLNDYFTYVGLSSAVLNKQEEKLTCFERIKLQLVQLLLSEKDLIIIDDIFQQLSVGQKQELLPLLQRITKEKNKAILVFTNDLQIAESPYIDNIVKSITA